MSRLHDRLARLESMLTPERGLWVIFQRVFGATPEDGPPDLTAPYAGPHAKHWIAPGWLVRLTPGPGATDEDCQRELVKLRADRREPVKVEPDEDERHPPRPVRKTSSNPNRISPQRRRRPR